MDVLPERARIAQIWPHDDGVGFLLAKIKSQEALLNRLGNRSADPALGLFCRVFPRGARQRPISGLYPTHRR
jgi:hypothetical protein